MIHSPHRHWVIAALAGAAAVILPVALVLAAINPMLADSLGVRWHDPEQNRTALVIGAALRTAGLTVLVGSIIGLPIALLFTGTMALLERFAPVAATLVAWVAGGIVAGMPVILLGMLLFGGLASVALLFDVVGVVGAGVAWAVRHGRGGRLA